MKEFKVSKDIAADPQTIWDLLTDAGSIADWNPAVDRVEGTIALGEKVKVYVPLSPGRAFPAKVTQFDPPSQMTWTGGMPLGLFKGVRTWTLTPAGGNTNFTMHEVYKGPLARLIVRTIPDMTDSFEQYAAGLKTKAESAA